MRTLFGLLAFLTFAGLMALAVLPVGLAVSMQLSMACIAGVLLFGFLPGRAARLFFVTLCTWVVLRYIGWRFESLPLNNGPLAGTAAVLLLCAELYGAGMLLLGLFVNAYPLDRPIVPLPRDADNWPTVDVFIPTYSEPMDVVAPTLLGAMEIDYPKDKLRVYALDDGYPRSLTTEDPEQRAVLQERTRQLQLLCERHGAVWLSRDKNVHAKSGNLNAAMKQTDGEFVLVLDADHVPTKDIVKNMVGGFLKDERLAFVQSPHFFLNADPIEKNLGLFNKIPAENDMFYRVVQKGLDLWNTSFFCGSAALLRRKALEDVGGFSVDSITEDASTSVKMHQRKWRSAYVGVPMVAGLQPETFAGFIVQRLRWATGMAQILVKQNPLTVAGLSAGQRLSYLSVVFFWLFPFARITFFIAPLLSVFFNMTIYPVGLEWFLAFTLPYLVAVIMGFERTFGRVRAILMSEVYETLQSFYALPALLGTFLQPNKPMFKVTPKGETLDEHFLSEFKKPFYFFYAMVSAGLVWGLARMVYEPEIRYSLALSVIWLFFNVVLLSAALGVMLEAPQRRVRPRVEVKEEVIVDFGDEAHRHAVIRNINENSAMLKMLDAHAKVPEHFIVRKGKLHWNASVLHHRRDPKHPHDIAVLLSCTTPEQERGLVSLVYGSSKRWQTLWEGRETGTNFLWAMGGVAVVALRSAYRHWRFVTRRQL